jgi:CheY-like chemotaxis protein
MVDKKARLCGLDDVGVRLGNLDYREICSDAGEAGPRWPDPCVSHPSKVAPFSRLTVLPQTAMVAREPHGLDLTGTFHPRCGASVNTETWLESWSLTTTRREAPTGPARAQPATTRVAAATGIEGVQLARTWHPDVILLDLMPPDIDGKEACPRLKFDATTREIPVIMVTGRSEEVDRMVGFELGAEDCVVKPFGVRELLLRIQRSLERQASAPTPPQAGGTFGCLRIDWTGHRVSVGDVVVPLTAIEFRLLAVLLQQRGRGSPVRRCAIKHGGVKSRWVRGRSTRR